jgi:hypothetical protein
VSLTTVQKQEARGILAEGESKRLGASYAPSIGRVEISRGWEIAQKKHSICNEYLETYCYAHELDDDPTDRVTDPHVGRNEIAIGTFLRINHGESAQNPRLLIQRLRKIYTPAAAAKADVTALAARAHGVTDKEDILRPLGMTSGTSFEKAFVYYDIDPLSEANCMAFAIADLASEISGAGWTYADRSFQIQQDGTAVFVAMFRKASWVKTWADKILIAVGGSGISESQTHRAAALSQTQAAADFPSVEADAGYVMLSRTLMEGALGERIIDRRQSKLNVYEEENEVATHPVDADALVIRITDTRGRSAGGIVRQWYRWDKAGKDELVKYIAAVAEPPTPAVYGIARSTFTFEGVVLTHVRVSITDHHDGAYTITQYLVDASLAATWDHNQITYGKLQTQTTPSGVEQQRSRRFKTFYKWRDDALTLRTVLISELQADPDSPWTPCHMVHGSLHVGGFNNYMYQGRITIDLGWTAWGDIYS